MGSPGRVVHCVWQGPQCDWCLVSSKLLYQDTLHALENLLISLLQQDMTPQGLQIMVEVGWCLAALGLTATGQPVFCHSLHVWECG